MSRLLRARGGLVDALSSALDSGGHGLSNVPALLKRLLAEEGWREFETVRGEVVRHERFEEFVAAPPLKGLGAEISLIKRIVADDPEAVDLLDRVLQRQVGHPREIVYNIHNSKGRPAGTSQARALRRLRKDAPELHAEVIAGRLSAHAAMVKAGFRTRTISVPVEHPDRVAAALRRHMTQEQLEELVRHLTDD